MLRRIRNGGKRESVALVKVAGVPVRQEAQTCLETLQGRGMEAEMREDEMGAFELWVPSEVEPLARFILGLSGHSVIRIPRPKRGKDA